MSWGSVISETCCTSLRLHVMRRPLFLRWQVLLNHFQHRPRYLIKVSVVFIVSLDYSFFSLRALQFVSVFLKRPEAVSWELWVLEAMGFLADICEWSCQTMATQNHGRIICSLMPATPLPLMTGYEEVTVLQVRMDVGCAEQCMTECRSIMLHACFALVRATTSSWETLQLVFHLMAVSLGQTWSDRPNAK